MKLGQHIDSNNTKVEVEMLTPKQLAKKEKDMQKIREQIAWEKELFAAILPPEELKKRRLEELKKAQLIQDHQDAWDEIAAEQLALAKAEMVQRTASGIPEPQL